MEKKLYNNFVVGAVLTNLSKAFDCIPHDILIAKLLAYDLSEEVLIYILYLTFQIVSIELDLTILTVSLKIKLQASLYAGSFFVQSINK